MPRPKYHKRGNGRYKRRNRHLRNASALQYYSTARKRPNWRRAVTVESAVQSAARWQKGNGDYA